MGRRLVAGEKFEWCVVCADVYDNKGEDVVKD